jgi:hypothetical protein
LGRRSGVLLRGHGRGVIVNSKVNFRANATSRLLWTGAAGGDGIVLTSDKNDSGTKVRRHGGGLVDFMLDGNQTGGRGLQVISHNDHFIRLMGAYWTENHFSATVLANGLTDSPSDNQSFVWDFEAAEPNTTDDAVSLFVVHGREAGDATTGVGANTSLGIISNLKLSAEAEGRCADFGNCDGIKVGKMQAGSRTSPTGGAVLIHAYDTLTNEPSSGLCRQLNFDYVQATGARLLTAAV